MAEKPPPLATEEMRRLLRLDADRQYGVNPPPGSEGYRTNAFLPVTTNKVGSASWVQQGANPQLALPEALHGIPLGIAGMADAPRTGSLSPETLRALLMLIRKSGSYSPGSYIPPGSFAGGVTQVPVERLMRPAPQPGLLSDRQSEVPIKDRVY